MTLRQSTRTLLITLASLACLHDTSAVAQSGKPIRIIVPFAAGGPIDVTTRILGEATRDALGGPVIVENRVGAGGNIGMEAIAKAVPDGTTLGIATTASHGINPWLFSKLPYDPAKDFVGITQILRVPNVLVINADSAKRLGIETLADLVKYAKANPGKLNYGSGGNGSAGHLAGEMFKNRAGVFIVHIPYNGGSPAQLALLSGQVDFNFDNLATAAGNLRAGKLKALAVTTAVRSSLLPKVPAVAETYPGFAIDLVGSGSTGGHAACRRDTTQSGVHSGAQLAGHHDPFCRTDGRTGTRHHSGVRAVHGAGARQL
jgi:tripartite-type tricarboxylate transporter receptor subunit TctC